MADREIGILAADRKYRISMELSNQSYLAALIREHPVLAGRPPVDTKQVALEGVSSNG